MSSEVWVQTAPACDIHRYQLGEDGVVALYDGRTRNGTWANMCSECFGLYGLGLGTGKGQQIRVGEKPKSAKRTLYECDSIEEMEELCGDGDPLDFL